MNKKTFLPIVLLSSSLAHGGLKVTLDFNEDPVSTVATCAGAAAGGYVGYKLWSWLSYKTARSLAEDANSAMDVCRSRYGNAMNILNQEFTAEEQKSRGAHKAIKESALFKLSENIKDLYGVSAAVLELSKCRSRLEKKRSSFMSGSDEDATFEKAYVEGLLVEIDVLLSSMQFLNSFVREHRGYFDNLALGKQLSLSEYAREIAIVNANAYDLVYQLNCCARGRFNNKDYPLAAYVEQVRADLSRLASIQRKLSYNYPFLTESARTLEWQLKRVAEVVETGPDYAQEKLQRREDQLKRERLRIEKKKADAEARKAEAKEREAYAREQQAAAEWAKVLQPKVEQPPVVIIN